LLDTAETLDPLLYALARCGKQAELGLEDKDMNEDTTETALQLILFDGEEAFMAWMVTDSIYGARSVCLSFTLLRSYILLTSSDV
jgi:hypothetical protein